MQYRHSLVFLILALACPVLSPVAALAQDPAVQPAPPPAPAPAPPPTLPLLSGTAELGFVATAGNSSTQSIGLTSDVTYRPDPWVLHGKVSFVRNEANGLVNAKSLATLTRLSRDLTPRLSTFAEYDTLRNVFAGIKQRNSIVGGVSYKVIEAAPHLLRLDGALGYANEQRVLAPALSAGTVLSGAAYKLKISATSEFSEEVRFVGSVTQGSDWRLEQSTAVTAKLNALLSLKASYVARHVNAPTAGFKKTDTVSSAALVAKF
jgi:putative salt-induced outer membrane protein